MSAVASELTGRPDSRTHAARFAVGAVLIAVAATALGILAPVSIGIGILFVFAGPHNWIEARYVLSRLPSRFAPVAPFMIGGVVGVLVLATSATLLPSVARATPLQWIRGANALTLLAMLWNVALIGWIAALLMLRSRQKPARDWWWCLPAALVIAALSCLQPLAWSLALVYLHPLVAFAILDRELRARRRDLRPAYHAVLALVPILLAVLWWQLRDAPPLIGQGDDALTMRLVSTAGGALIKQVPAHFLVASHVLLETLHYAVWLIAIPAFAIRGRILDVARIPVATRSVAARRAIQLVLAASACLVVALWAAFTQHQVAARDLYFTLSIVHVLAEAPLLIRLL